jgi:hypothetical protein
VTRAALAPSRGDAWEADDVGAGLGKAKNRVSGDPELEAARELKRKALRRLERKLKRVAQALTTAKGVKICGRRRAGPYAGAPVEIRRNAAGKAFYAGLLRCGSVWECPTCMERIQTGRAEEVERIGAAHRGRGGELYLATLTIPHHQGQPLLELRKRIGKAWRAVQQGRRWIELRRRAGLVAWIVAREVTVGGNGWHPHVHVLLLTARPLPFELERELLEHLQGRWEQEITRGQDWQKPSRAHGVSVVRASRADYVAKLAGELTRGGHKGSRATTAAGDHNRTPLELLEDVMRLRRPADVALWREYAASMRGACQLTWGGELRTKKGRAAFGVDVQTDLELAQEERQPAETLVSIEADLWDSRLAYNDALQCRLLEEAERRPAALEARDWLEKALELLRGNDPPPF